MCAEGHELGRYGEGLRLVNEPVGREETAATTLQSELAHCMDERPSRNEVSSSVKQEAARGKIRRTSRQSQQW